MKLVVAALRPTPILWWRASGLESPTEVPASTLPARGMAPVRARMASRSVVLPLWKGPTSAMHRGPRGLLTSCPIAASSFGARPVIGSANQMLRPSRCFGKRETWLRCIVTDFTSRPPVAGGETAEQKSTSRPQFQAFQSGSDADADLALHAQRLQRDRIVGSANQHIAADTDAERRTTLCAGVGAGEVARPEPRHRREHAPGQRGFLGDAEIETDLADGGDVAIVGNAVDTQHAAEVGHGTDNETNAGAAAALENADLHASLLRAGAGDGCGQHGKCGTGKNEEATHEEVSG